jgi:hypothetical protein
VGPSRTIPTAKCQLKDRAEDNMIEGDAWNVGSAALSMIAGAIESNACSGGMVAHVSGSSVMVMMVAVRCVVAPPR